MRWLGSWARAPAEVRFGLRPAGLEELPEQMERVLKGKQGKGRSECVQRSKDASAVGGLSKKSCRACRHGKNLKGSYLGT